MIATRETISKAIRQAREAKGLKHGLVASALGVTVSAVSQWESGESGLTDISLLKIACLLDIDLAKLEAVQPSQRLRTLDESQTDDTQIVDTPCRAAALQEQIEEVLDLLHAMDKIGDGIGGADGYAVSAVALSAKSVADNVLDGLKALTRGSRACVCAREVA